MKQQMTAQEFRALKIKTKITGDKDKGSKAKQWMARQILYWANEKGFEYQEEYQFSKERKFRSDNMVRELFGKHPHMKVLIEYEGLNSDKSGHTTFLGFSKNCIKYNLATVEGWDLLRYTAKNYKNVIADLDAIYQRKIGG
jgi:hypothetical protein